MMLTLFPPLEGKEGERRREGEEVECPKVLSIPVDVDDVVDVFFSLCLSSLRREDDDEGFTSMEASERTSSRSRVERRVELRFLRDLRGKFGFEDVAFKL